MARNTSELVYVSTTPAAIAEVPTIGGNHRLPIGTVGARYAAVQKLNATTLALLPDHAFDVERLKSEHERVARMGGG